MGKDAEPEDGAPVEVAVEIACLRAFGGRLAANIVVLNYTHLYAFIAFYHLFLGG